jgi:hypothetical protein
MNQVPIALSNEEPRISIVAMELIYKPKGQSTQTLTCLRLALFCGQTLAVHQGLT